MKSQIFSFSAPLSLFKKRTLILIQFFLIIFVYHTLKDLKDTIVITGSEAGAEVIPFIKIWAMLPLAVAASYFFAKLYNRFGREKTLYFFVGLLLSVYLLFAFVLYPFRQELYLDQFSHYLRQMLPIGARGGIAMVGFWHYTLFYLAAELWSLLVLSILFWGYVNETTSLEDAKQFYPLCMFTGNFAGILSGQVSHFLCHHLANAISWQLTLQLMVAIVAFCGMAIMKINHWLSKDTNGLQAKKQQKARQPHSFKDNLSSIFKSMPLLCIALLVVGFGLTSNLIEVVWKENIRQLHPSPQAYNAYINQLTSLIGLFAVIMAFASRWIFQLLSWTKVALLTPLALFATSLVFFSSLLLPGEQVSWLSSFVAMSPLQLVVTLGSIYYVLAMTAKYTIFDTTKEMAFLSIEAEERMRAKSVIDSIGSRLGKSGASCFYQFLLISFGATAGHISVIGMTSIVVISFSILATKKLGGYLSDRGENLPLVEAIS
ncbi:Npt1/Npt2 family nucleotide transporter [Candidatus Protochlamydia phocaeensis]|uniref:Npt1/Npt2 family nucleotide transporter n=1 Tax=Candidatus Protochlamydia phocaeensis TaxID=1414722 RepID=UPI0012AB9EB6|nr:Npt1/Npt2 family nucleotide transporter [Candidatus Protochlamydia phocaeensis]